MTDLPKVKLEFPIILKDSEAWGDCLMVLGVHLLLYQHVTA